MMQSPETRLARAERDLTAAIARRDRASHWAQLARDRGDLMHEGERADWRRLDLRVATLRARVSIRREALEHAQSREAVNGRRSG